MDGEAIAKRQRIGVVKGSPKRRQRQKRKEVTIVIHTALHNSKIICITQK